MGPHTLTESAGAPTDRAHRRHRLRRIAKATAVILAVLTFSACWEFRRPWFRNNLGVVEPGKVFRSAQPTSDLDGLIRDHHLQSILNLRGGGPDDPWYAAEVEATRSGSIAFYDFPMSATRRPSRRELLVLIDTLRSCAYPLLIHCKSGADRTGLATALYLMIARGVPPRRAEETFTLEHGHVPLLGPERLHEPLHEYDAWLSAHHLAHTPDRFRAWVRDEYRSDDPREDPPALQPGPRRRHTRGPDGHRTASGDRKVIDR